MLRPNKSIRNSAGFAVPEALLIIVILGIIGGTGYFVWQAKHNADESLRNTANSQPGIAIGEKSPQSIKSGPIKTSGDETAEWYLYKAPSGAFTMKLADGWLLYNDQGSDTIGTLDNENLKLIQGTKAKIMAAPGKDSDSGMFISYATKNTDQVATPGQKQGSLTTTDGIEIEKYYGPTTGAMSGDSGYEQYTYVIRKSTNRVIVIQYSFKSTMTDYHETIEKVVKTLHFN